MLCMFMVALYKAIFDSETFVSDCKAQARLLMANHCAAKKHAMFRLQANYDGTYASNYAATESAVAKMRAYAAASFLSSIGSAEARGDLKEAAGDRANTIREAIPEMLRRYDVTHITPEAPRLTEAMA